MLFRPTSFQLIARTSGLWPKGWESRKRRDQWCGRPSAQSHFSSNLTAAGWGSTAGEGCPLCPSPWGCTRHIATGRRPSGGPRNTLQNLQLPVGLGAPGALLPWDSTDKPKSERKMEERLFCRLLDTKGLNLLNLSPDFSLELMIHMNVAPSWLS